MNDINQNISIQIAVPMTKRELRLINDYVDREGLKKGALTRRALLTFIREKEREE